VANFADRLHRAIAAKSSRVVVGLDPDFTRLPERVAPRTDDPRTVGGAIERFCLEIIEAVAPYCVAVKAQAAYFERLGGAGWLVLERVVKRAKDHGLLVILDAKRGDIGSTSVAYAQGLLGRPPQVKGELLADAVDALTVNPYLGSDGVKPFIAAAAERDKGVFVLVKTSNPSSAELQDLRLAQTGEMVYQAVGRLVAQWGEDLVGECGYSAVGAVVGATHPEAAARLRELMPRVPFLVPGFGAQGAGPEDIKPCFDAQGRGAVVNSARGIIFACEREPYLSRFGPARFAEAAAAACDDMRCAINDVLGLAAERRDSQ